MHFTAAGCILLCDNCLLFVQRKKSYDNSLPSGFIALIKRTEEFVKFQRGCAHLSCEIYVLDVYLILCYSD